MLGQRRRRWPNINPILGQCIVFSWSEEGWIGVKTGIAGVSRAWNKKGLAVK